MRRIAAAFLSMLVLACSTPCEDLGNKICSCYSGTTKDDCENQVEERVDEANPNGEQEDFCEARLDTCHAPEGARFCDWINTRAGKEACGLAYPTDEG